MFSLLVTSTFCAFLITRVSQFAATVPSATCVALSFEAAVSTEYPLGSVLTLTAALCAFPSYVNEPPVVVTVISPAYSVTVSFPILSLIV